MLVLNLLCVKHSVLSCKLVTDFSTYSMLILYGKRGKHYELHVIFQDIEHQLQENIFHHSLNYKVSLIH